MNYFWILINCVFAQHFCPKCGNETKQRNRNWYNVQIFQAGSALTYSESVITFDMIFVCQWLKTFHSLLISFNINCEKLFWNANKTFVIESIAFYAGIS